MRFEWDEEKNRTNKATHKIAFETARLVFDDPRMLNVLDHVVDDEERWQTLGMVSGVIVIVAHTYREQDGIEKIRLISAGKATPGERRSYDESWQVP